MSRQIASFFGLQLVIHILATLFGIAFNSTSADEGSPPVGCYELRCWSIADGARMQQSRSVVPISVAADSIAIILDDEALLTRLNLQSSQKLKIGEVRTEARAFREKVEKLFLDGFAKNDTKIDADLGEQFLDASRTLQTLDEKLRSTLSASQEDEWRRLAFRHSICMKGLIPSLLELKLITSDQSEAFRRRASERFKPIVDDLTSINANCGENLCREILRALSVEQQRALERFIGKPTDYVFRNGEVLVWQSRVPVEKKSLSDADEFACAATKMSVSFTGELLPIPGSFLSSHSAVVRVMTDRNNGRIEILDYQLGELGNGEDHLLRSQQSTKEIKSLRTDLLANRITVNQFFGQSMRSRALLMYGDFQTLRGSLLREQQDEWDRVVDRWVITVRGLPWMLAEGSVGRELDVSPQQAAKIRAASIGVAEIFSRELSRIESAYWRRLREDLAENVDTSELDRLLPRNIDGLKPIPNMLVRSSIPQEK